ncbi:MAG: PQQ-dependent sugar dehydrogenase [Thermodesulfovibrionales bacterium]
MFIASLFSNLKTYAGNRKISIPVPASAVCALLLAACLLSMQHEAAAVVTAWPNISLIKVNGGLVHPVDITHAGDDSRRLFVVEQGGRIMIIRADVLLAAPFLDISDRVLSGGERGLLSVAFPPGFATSGRFYVNYTRQPDGATVVARYHVSANPDIADHLSEERLLVISQPFPNHNGGQLAFGPDGFLYIGMGDGGSAGDPRKYAQNHGSLLGKMLRIDVESGTLPYSVPPTNPFVQTLGYLPEIWALGLRNPWRFSFDRQTGDLYIGDVGQNLYEEVDFQPAASTGGENYGWNIMEASHCYLSTSCSSAGLVLPVAEYDHTTGDCAVIGGMVYRGQKYPGLQEVYLYGDYCTGRIRGLKKDGGSFQNTILFASPYAITTFGEDESGSIYLSDYKSGSIYRVIETVTGIPVPAGRQAFTFPTVDSPTAALDPAQLNPFGFGPIASGGKTVQFQVALARFTAPVDLYIAYSVSTDPANIFLVKPDFTFHVFSFQDARQVLSGVPVAGIEPWMKNVTGPIDVNPLTLSVTKLSPGIYTVYLLVTPSGRLDSHYLGMASFVVP